MSSRTKKAIVILVAILGLVAIGIGVYFGIQNAKQSIIPGSQSSQGSGGTLGTQGQAGQSAGASQGGSFPVSSSGNQGSGGTLGTQGQAGQSAGAFQSQKNNLFQLSTHPAAVYWVVSSTSTTSTTAVSGILHTGVYYMDTNGTIFQIQDVGSEQMIAGSSLGVPLRLWQNSDGSKIVVLFSGVDQGADATTSQSSGQYALFRLTTKAWEILPQGTVSVAFSPDGKRLALLRQTGGTTSLYVTNIATARETTTLIASLAIVDVTIAWPSPNKIYFVPRTASSIDSQAWYIDPTTKNMAYFGHGLGLQLVFSPARPYSVLQFVSSLDASSVSLSIDDSTGAMLQTLSLQTIAEKCSFSSNGQAIFCAVPRENNKSNGDPLSLPDDFLQRAAYFHDNLYEIKGSAISTLVNAPDVLFDIVDIKSTPSQLFFMNRLDHTIYLYNLPNS